MRQKIKVIITILMCIILLILFFHTDTQSILENLYRYPVAKNDIYEDYIYDTYSDHINIVTYNGSEINVAIPAYIRGLPVRSIEDSAFYGNQTIEQVIIPNTIIKIGYQSFIGCQNLKEVYLPKSILYIGASAFENCPNLEFIYMKKNKQLETLLEENHYSVYIQYQ